MHKFGQQNVKKLLDTIYLGFRCQRNNSLNWKRKEFYSVLLTFLDALGWKVKIYTYW